MEFPGPGRTKSRGFTSSQDTLPRPTRVSCSNSPRGIAAWSSARPRPISSSPPQAGWHGPKELGVQRRGEFEYCPRNRSGGKSADPNGYQAEFLNLARKAQTLCRNITATWSGIAGLNRYKTTASKIDPTCHPGCRGLLSSWERHRKEIDSLRASSNNSVDLSALETKVATMKPNPTVESSGFFRERRRSPDSRSARR
jgi:hypothetical protein